MIILKNNHEKENAKFDAFLKMAATEAFYREMETLPSNEDMNQLYSPSPELEKRIGSMVAKHERKLSFSKNIKFFQRIAAGFIILFIVTTASLMSIQASRSWILNAITRFWDEHISFRFSRGQVAEFNINDFSFHYLPYGFVQQFAVSEDDFYNAIYMNDDGKIIVILIATYENIELSASIEFYHQHITINNRTSYILEAEREGESTMLILLFDEHVIKITAEIEVDEIIKIAKNFTR